MLWHDYVVLIKIMPFGFNVVFIFQFILAPIVKKMLLYKFISPSWRIFFPRFPKTKQHGSSMTIIEKLDMCKILVYFNHCSVHVCSVNSTILHIIWPRDVKIDVMWKLFFLANPISTWSMLVSASYQNCKIKHLPPRQ